MVFIRGATVHCRGRTIIHGPGAAGVTTPQPNAIAVGGGGAAAVRTVDFDLSLATSSALMGITVASIVRYPVKGLSGEQLGATRLAVGEGLPCDRQFALALAGTRFDPANPQWLPKTGFLMLMRNERLAALETRYDDEDATFTVRRDGRDVVKGKLTTPLGRAVIEDFFGAYMASESAGKPKLVTAGSTHMFSDHRMKVLSIINLASLRDLERVVGRVVEPARFRGNLYIDGSEPWSEFRWEGGEIAIGDARLEVTARIDRCAATNVRPGAGVRDMNIPKALTQGFGHVDCGVYARVVTGGDIAVGDVLSVPE